MRATAVPRVLFTLIKVLCQCSCDAMTLTGRVVVWLHQHN